MSDFGLIADNGTIRFQRLLPEPAEYIWEYLTKPSLLATWLAEGEIQSRIGGYVELSFSFTEGTDYSMAGSAICGVVTRYDPPESLAFTWTDSTIITRVTFELERRNAGVLFLLIHAGLPIERVAKRSARWHAHLDILHARLLKQPIEPFESRFGQLISHYETLRDARTAPTDAG